MTIASFFFHFVIVVSNLSKDVMCSSRFALMSTNNSLCSQFGYLGFLDYISIDSYDLAFFFVLSFVFKGPPSS
jgi:hypothetical protein